jgi:hypothetical protein
MQASPLNEPDALREARGRAERKQIADTAFNIPLKRRRAHGLDERIDVEPGLALQDDLVGQHPGDELVNGVGAASGEHPGCQQFDGLVQVLEPVPGDAELSKEGLCFLEGTGLGHLFSLLASFLVFLFSTAPAIPPRYVRAFGGCLPGSVTQTGRTRSAGVPEATSFRSRS